MHMWICCSKFAKLYQKTIKVTISEGCVGECYNQVMFESKCFGAFKKERYNWVVVKMEADCFRFCFSEMCLVLPQFS